MPAAACRFHYYRCDLDAMPNPELAHERRGAAFTFNAPVFVNCLRRLLDDSQAAHPIPFPSFDHAVGDPVQDDVWVMPKHQVVLVEVRSESKVQLIVALRCVYLTLKSLK